MKIYLYLAEEILTFSLPNNISGSFSFDKNPEEESKLINIEAQNGNWYIYATADVSVISDNNIVSEAILKVDAFYVLRRNEKNYLISTSAIIDKSLYSYNYNEKINLIVGNNEKCNITYPCEYLNDIAFTINCVNNNQLLLTKNNNTLIYVNEKVLTGNSYYIQNGDQINLYGLKIWILPGILLINNPAHRLSIKTTEAHINQQYIGNPGVIKELEIKDQDLYDKDDYFSKAPRLRRTIEKKEIRLDKPPQDNSGNDMPILLTIGPMLTMGIISLVTLANTLQEIYVGEADIEDSWPSILMAVAMLASMLLWPIILNFYNKKRDKKKKEEIIQKYNIYLNEKRQELDSEKKLQKSILIENLITVEECLNIIQNKTINFWDKRIDQNDFLVARIGVGNELLNVKINYPEDGFTIEESELKKQADNLVNEYKYIENVPIGYSFYENKVTAIMSTELKSLHFMNNVLLQLLTFYSYEDLKIVVFTNEENKRKWNYIKYLNHNFTNGKTLRFFASSIEEYKIVSEYITAEIANRLAIEQNNNIPPKPYYLILIDDYDKAKRFEFIKQITEIDQNLGFSIVLLENRLSNLPSKCNNFISIGEKSSGVLKNSYEKQEQIVFYDEINYRINMMEVAKALANVPIEFESSVGQLPDTITFLEMEKVGKVKQLNILNRWNTNDTTTSLKAEVGVDSEGDYMYLDLHEKAHGPHGLVAGMTGSGKSEFIITYILSMAINYSPDDVAFVLIDYKGGGLAFAFENKATNMILPHLAGTITNLDKAEMDRTLVSIDSEVKRRQKEFNEARDKLGESTIDIYKYQRFYKEGKISKPIPHLFIICDEFAELKSQQPDFMDNLISIARIGRSLGVHLILATQKPSGVVNDQIWSNSKFHVCLKVQDESDSNEMLKRPDAANLKQTGRFYLQVGYDEYFGLGQSAWCGAKYFPSDKVQKAVDKSVDFIEDDGILYKKIQASSGAKMQAQGEQLSAILKEVIEVANQTGKKVSKLWLDNIPEVILIKDLIRKYQVNTSTDDISAIIGEYDAPERQEQGLLSYSFLRDGNTTIYGNDGAESEMLLNSIICSTITKYSSTELNYYILDFGSQAFRKFEKLNHVGGVVVIGEDEKYKNFFKMIKEELENRKKILSEYGVDFAGYKKSNNPSLPIKVVIMNNYDAINETDKNLFDELPGIIRDSERYGIIFILTANGVTSIPRKITQSCPNVYALKLNDETDYRTIFNVKKAMSPRSLYGRGVYQYEDILHEFQTASIIESKETLNEYLMNQFKEINANNPEKADKIPCVPNQVLLEDVEKRIKTIKAVPIGIDKNTIEVAKYNFIASPTTLIIANRLQYTRGFVKSLIDVLLKIKNTNLIVFDPSKKLETKKEQITNYYNDNIENCITSVTEYLKGKMNNQEKGNVIILVYGLEKLLNKVTDKKVFETLLENIKQYELSSMIICESVKKVKGFMFENWYSNYINQTEGIFVGRGAGDQSILKIANYSKELMEDYPNNVLFLISEGTYTPVKALEFEKESDEDEEDETL